MLLRACRNGHDTETALTLWDAFAVDAADAGRIHIYSQGDEKWLQVAYGPEGSGKTLNEQGCGVFALAHAAQWLGLEEKDERETLPVSRKRREELVRFHQKYIDCGKKCHKMC